MGTLKDSKFLEKGVLTPEEFVLAGEHLTHKCNTWKWESGKDNLMNKNLPADMQYLVTKGVPCEKRIKDL
jgi:ubiquitin-like-conjugating enzyme ATG3